MHVYSEIAVMVLVFMACWGGLALAKATQQREEAEGESLSRINPASSRMAATTLRSQVRRDVSQRFAARVGEQDRAFVCINGVDLGGYTSRRQPTVSAPRSTSRSGGDTAA